MKSRTFLSQTQSNVSAHLPTFDDKLLKHNAVKWQLEKKKSGCHYSKNKTKQETKAQASENTRQQQSAVPSWLKIASKTYHGLFFLSFGLCHGLGQSLHMSGSLAVTTRPRESYCQWHMNLFCPTKRRKTKKTRRKRSVSKICTNEKHTQAEQ